MNFKLKTPKSQSSSLILFYVNLPDGSRFVYSTGQKIPVRLWDSHAQLPKKTKSQNDQMIVNTVNLRLDKIKSCFMKINLDCKAAGKTLSKQLLKQEFDIQFKGVKRKESPKSFDECFEDFYNFKIKEGQWSNSTAERYRMIQRQMKEYDKTLSMESFDSNWLLSFKEYSETEKLHQVNTVGRNLGLIKTFLNYCLKQGYITDSSFKDCAVSREVTKQLALSKEDIQRIEDLDLSKNKRLERVRDVFLLGCYTGMRYSDFKRVKASNIYNGLIKIREVKDKEKFLEIPITDRVRVILEKYNMILPVISEQKFRDYLKEIFKIAGFTNLQIKSIRIGKNVHESEVPMYDLMSTHTARRSFITHMLNSGVPAKAIMAITGHKSINNFQLYYKPTNDVLAEFMKSAWK